MSSLSSRPFVHHFLRFAPKSRCCSIYIHKASSCLQPSLIPSSIPLLPSPDQTRPDHGRCPASRLPSLSTLVFSLSLHISVYRGKQTKAVAALLLFAYASAVCTSLCTRRRITGHLVTPVQARLWLHGMPSSSPSASPPAHVSCPPPLPCPSAHHSMLSGHDYFILTLPHAQPPAQRSLACCHHLTLYRVVQQQHQYHH